MVNGRNARKDRSERLFLFDTNNGLKTPVISRNSFKTNNSVDFYSIQTAIFYSIQTNFLSVLHRVSRACGAQRQSCRSLPPCAGAYPELKWGVIKPKQHTHRGTIL